MTKDKIPEKLYIRGELWTVVWVDHEHPEWRALKQWGDCDHYERTIRLDNILQHLPGKLGQIWIHELLHACMPTRREHGRPRGLSNELEEAFINAIDGSLDLVLNQVKWT